MADQTDLPEDVALLWGLREVPRRGPKPSLTIEDITRAAIEVADAEGLAAVSMARVAAQLGNATMALYRHIRSKDELLVLMSDAALSGPPVLPEEGNWRSKLEQWAANLMVAHARHPWYVQLPITRPPVGPHNLAWLDSALGALADTPLTEPEKFAVVMGLVTYMHGHVRLGSELAVGYAENPDAFSRQYSLVLKRMVDPRRFPALGEVVEAGVFDADSLFEEEDLQADYEFGLSLYLDGVAGIIASCAARGANSAGRAPTD